MNLNTAIQQGIITKTVLSFENVYCPLFTGSADALEIQDSPIKQEAYGGKHLLERCFGEHTENNFGYPRKPNFVSSSMVVKCQSLIFSNAKIYFLIENEYYQLDNGFFLNVLFPSRTLKRINRELEDKFFYAHSPNLI